MGVSWSIFVATVRAGREQQDEILFSRHDQSSCDFTYLLVWGSWKCSQWKWTSNKGCLPDIDRPVPEKDFHCESVGVVCSCCDGAACSFFFHLMWILYSVCFSEFIWFLWNLNGYFNSIAFYYYFSWLMDVHTMNYVLELFQFFSKR